MPVASNLKPVSGRWTVKFTLRYFFLVIISRVMMFCFPIWLWQEALWVDRRDASRRFCLFRSLMKLTEYNYGYI